MPQLQLYYATKPQKQTARATGRFTGINEFVQFPHLLFLLRSLQTYITFFPVHQNVLFPSMATSVKCLELKILWLLVAKSF